MSSRLYHRIPAPALYSVLLLVLAFLFAGGPAPVFSDPSVVSPARLVL